MAAAVKAPKSHSASVTRTGPFFGNTRSPGFLGAVQRAARPEIAVQAKLSVSRHSDPLEKEADRTADRVMRAPADEVHRAADPTAAVPPLAGPTAAVQRFGEGTPTVAADAQGEIVRATTGGDALPATVRSYMEPRLGAELGDVRVHADESAASLSNHLSARAFTYRNHVFFARGQYQPGTQTGRHLLAHELTHTIQQGATVQRAAATAGDQPARVQAPAPQTVPPAQRASTTATPKVQRWGLDSILDFFADKAAYIPGFRMLTLVIGVNPINMRRVDRTPANFLRALIELVPGGAVITRALDSHGVINRAADWVMAKVEALGDIGASIVDGIKRFISDLGWSDALHPGAVWDRAKRLVLDPIGRLISFGAGVVGELLSLVKEAILRPLAALAEGTAGYDLLKAVLGQDPITGDPVPRTADTLIGGFMKLIGQEEIWANIKKGNAVARAFAWFQGALAGLMGFVRSIPQKVVATITSLTFEDVLTVVGAFRKVGSAFLGLVAEFGSWAGRQVLSLLEILVSVVAPGVMPYIAKAKAAFHTIIRDPVRFIGNLVRAGKLGFQNFARNIVEHLKTALIKWLVGPLADAGVYIPKSFSLLEIVKLVLSVLGLTWANIRTKLLKIIPEPVLVVIEKTASVLTTLVTEGPAAAWEQIKGELTELKDQLIGQVTQMITTEVVKAAVTKLVMMLNPAGAVIQAIMAIYNTVMFFVEKISQIGAVVASVIDSISAIASGQVEGAAKRVEQTLANTLVVVLGFLARFAGLGGIPAKLVGIVKKIRQPIDKGLDRIVAWLGRMLEKVKGALGGDTSQAVRDETRTRIIARTSNAKSIEEVRSAIGQVRTEMTPRGLSELELRPAGDEGVYDILVAASAKKKEGEVVDYLKRDAAKADVAARATITFAEPPDVSSLKFPNVPGAPSASQAGTLVMPPEKGSKSLEVQSASGKTLRKRGTNVSHAEYHLSNFVAGAKLGSQIVQVDLSIPKMSPCRECAGQLVELARTLKGRNSGVVLNLTYGTRLHRSWDGKGHELTAMLSAAEWSVPAFDEPKEKVKVSGKG
jgi:Domain of unknown function (DUF4157)